MPNFPWPSRRDASVTGDPSLAALLAWAQFPENPAPEMRRVGEILAALTAGPADDELAGETAVLVAYRSRPAMPRPAPRAHRRRRRPFSSFLPVTAAAAAAILGLGALATAAYTGALPTPVQQIAHDIIGAPAAKANPPPAGLSPVGQGATSHARATAAHPGKPPAGRPHPSPTPHATAHPTTQPTPTGSSTQPTPTESGTPTPTHGKHKGKPTSHPTPPGHRKPTA